MSLPLRLSPLLGLAFVAPLHAAKPAETRPNIILILADDLGYGDVSAYNPEAKFRTPHLDRLAAQGLRLTDAHTPAAVCTPTRYGVLTGRNPWRGSWRTAVLKPGDPCMIEPELTTLPELLQSAGYRTAAFGKWHLGLTVPKKAGKPDYTQRITNGPLQHGFDTYEGMLFGYRAWVSQDRIHLTPEGSIQVMERHEFDPRTLQVTLDYLEAATAKPAQPFFAYVNFSAPHNPLKPIPAFQGKSGLSDYADFVLQLDDMIGQLLAALDRHGLADNTLVLFTSDNGPDTESRPNDNDDGILAYQRIQRYGHASMATLRGTKQMPWEGGHRVPFIARWPGRIPAGSESPALFALTDLLATLGSLAGAPLPKTHAEDSIDQLPRLLRPAETPALRRGGIFASNDADILAVRRDQLVLIEATSDERPYGFKAEPAWFRESRGIAEPYTGRELYDLAADPGQTKNLYATKPELVADLKAWGDRLRREGDRAAHAAP